MYLTVQSQKYLKTIPEIYGWGTHNSGIDVFNPNGEAIKYFTHLPNELSLSHQSVLGMAKASSNKIWGWGPMDKD